MSPVDPILAGLSLAASIAISSDPQEKTRLTSGGAYWISTPRLADDA
jgi:hypothetical protein